MAATISETLGARIREARREAGFKNVEQLAVILDVGQRTLQRWETGKAQPSVTKVIAIAEATRKPLAFFFGEQAA